MVDLAVCADHHAALAVWSELSHYFQATTVEVLAQTVNLTSIVNEDRDR